MNNKIKTGISAKIVADSISEHGIRLTTMELNYHRFIHSEFMTHRMFSRNAASSRAIPIEKMLEQVQENPAMPIHWGKNQPGMQAREECNNLVGMDWDYYNDWDVKGSREAAWIEASNNARNKALAFSFSGYHKQIVNRLLEPFQYIKVIVTATEWDNFFKLRLHEDAQPEIAQLALRMKEAMGASSPVTLLPGQWHLPYIQEEDCLRTTTDNFVKLSVARCARVSMLNHDGSNPHVEKDLYLYDRLVGSTPEHASPSEHQACPMPSDVDFTTKGVSHLDKYGNYWSGNFRGFLQYRKILEDTNWGRH